jgi:predicted nucleic acid-binding protein
MKVYFDTNILIASLQPGHIHHIDSLAAYRRVKSQELTGCLSNQGLTEFYSVLTRAPLPKPFSAADVFAVIEDSIVPNFTIVDVTTESYLAALARCAKAGWRGGRVHDAVYIQAAVQTQCDLIYTYDMEHFRALAPEWGERIQSPPQG